MTHQVHTVVRCPRKWSGKTLVEPTVGPGTGRRPCAIGLRTMMTAEEGGLAQHVEGEKRKDGHGDLLGEGA